MSSTLLQALQNGSFYESMSPKPRLIDFGRIDDHFAVFASLRSEFSESYLLESLAHNEHSDPTVTFGFGPILTVTARDHDLTLSQGTTKETHTVENPYDLLHTLVPKPLQTDAHYGGLIGYFSYEAVSYFEPSLRLPEHPDFPQFELGLYMDGLTYNLKTQQLTYYYFLENRSDIVKAAIAKSSSSVGRITSVVKHGHNRTRAQHAKDIAYTLDQIRSGNSFQAEVGFKTKYTIVGDKLAVYKRLREVNPGPYMYYMQFGKRELFGSSPEIIVRNSGRKLLTTPAAGTTGRGKTDAEDELLASQLQNDPKENAEHNMLIDLHRNDLARVSRIGSVRLDRTKYIAKYSHVQHLLSDISGELMDGKTSFDVLASMTPCGVLTGAPKIETIKIIHHSEPEPRGPYGGAIGRFSLNGDCVFTMPIRSLFCAGDNCFAQTASGVVLDSTADGEYAEVERKLAAMEAVINGLSEGEA